MGGHHARTKRWHHRTAARISIRSLNRYPRTLGACRHGERCDRRHELAVMLVASSLVHRWRHLLDGVRTSQSTSTKHGATARPRLLNSADRSEIVEMGIWCRKQDSNL